MVERSYGLAENGLKLPKNQEKPNDPWWSPPQLRRPDPWASEAVGRENLPVESSGCPPPLCPARVAGGRPVVPPLVQTPTARKWSNCPTWCSRFWRVFLRVLELKMVFWG